MKVVAARFANTNFSAKCPLFVGWLPKRIIQAWAHGSSRSASDHFKQKISRCSSYITTPDWSTVETVLRKPCLHITCPNGKPAPVYIITEIIHVLAEP